jgi:RND family efflux transporter MFP subunit
MTPRPTQIPRRRLCWLAAVLALPAALQAQPAAPAPAIPSATPPATQAAGLDCMIQPHQVVQLGTAAPGVIQSIRVERGDVVRRGQALVQMQAGVERAALAVARERAGQSGEVLAARGAHDLASREVERASELLKENFVSRTYFDRQRAEAQVADGRGQQAEERRQLAEREVQLAWAQLAQRTVVSPIDGVVVERFASPGEYVEQKPVLRIAALDPLRVDVLVPAAAFGQVSVGAKVQVVPELLNRSLHSATVTSVDRVIDAASNTFRVRLTLPNPGGALPPGLRCKADLGLRGIDTARRDAAPGALPGATPGHTPAAHPAGTTPTAAPAGMPPAAQRLKVAAADPTPPPAAAPRR